MVFTADDMDLTYLDLQKGDAIWARQGHRQKDPWPATFVESCDPFYSKIQWQSNEICVVSNSLIEPLPGGTRRTSQRSSWLMPEGAACLAKIHEEQLQPSCGFYSGPCHDADGFSLVKWENTAYGVSSVPNCWIEPHSEHGKGKRKKMASARLLHDNRSPPGAASPETKRRQSAQTCSFRKRRAYPTQLRHKRQAWARRQAITNTQRQVEGQAGASTRGQAQASQQERPAKGRPAKGLPSCGHRNCRWRDDIEKGGVDYHVYVDEQGSVSKPIELKNQRLYPKDLENLCPGGRHFIWNKNCHKFGKALKGSICYYNGAIYVLVGGQGKCAIALMLFPRKDENPFVLDLDVTFQEGFFLQQVGGEAVGKVNGCDMEFPRLCSRDMCEQCCPQGPFIVMNPDGGDCIDVDSKYDWCLSVSQPCPFVEPEGIARTTKTSPSIEQQIEQQQKEEEPDYVDAVYVKESTKRMSDLGKSEFCLPIGKPTSVCGTDRFKLQKFVELSEDELRKLLEEDFVKGGFTDSAFEEWMKSYKEQEFELVVPSLNAENKNLRIHVLSGTAFERAKHKHRNENSYFCIGENEYLFVKESADLNNTPGNLVSYWEISSLISEPNLKYEYAAACGDVFGSGFGSRGICNVIGLNVYRGARCCYRPHPSPLVDDNDIPYHQYYSTMNRKPLLQATVEKHLNILTFQAKNFFAQSYNSLASISDHKGERRILTCGKRPFVSKKKNPPSSIGQYPVFGFANGKHCDSGDVYPKSILQIMEGNDSECVKKLGKFEGFCGPTTCGYQFLY